MREILVSLLRFILLLGSNKFVIKNVDVLPFENCKPFENCNYEKLFLVKNIYIYYIFSLLLYSYFDYNNLYIVIPH